MFKLLKNINSKNNDGFSLVELLVVLLIMSVIAGIAVPLYLNQKQRAYLAVAQSDATSVGEEISSIVSDYTSFGTLAGTINITGGFIVFDGMTSATGSGMANTTAGAGLSGPLTTTSSPRLSNGSTLTGNWGTNSINWCIEVINNGTYAKYTDAGLTLSGIGTPSGSQLCVSGV